MVPTKMHQPHANRPDVQSRGGEPPRQSQPGQGLPGLLGRWPEGAQAPTGPSVLARRAEPMQAPTGPAFAARFYNEEDAIANAAAKLTLGPNDVIIAVMGVTGTGKSAFIHHLAGDGVKIGHSLHSCTSEVEIHPFVYGNGRTIYILDTPGFDDTRRGDAQILEELAYFLGATYSGDVKLAGLIYLHRITDTRMSGTALRNLHLFKALCGEKSLANVVLATTMWDKLKDRESMERGRALEGELRAGSGFWGDMIDMGSCMFRHNNTYASAILIVDHIMHLEYPTVLDIQRQMIDEHLKLEQTTAGQEVQRELLQVKQQYEEELENTRKQMEIAIKDGDERMADKLARMEDDYKKKIKKSDEDQKQLQANFEKIQKAKDEETKAKIAELQKQAEKYQKEAEANLQAVEQVKSRQAESDEKLEQLKKESKEAASRYEAEKAERDEEYQRKEQEWREEMERKTQELQEKSKKSSSVAAFLAIGMVGLGILTVNPVLIGAGGTMLAGAKAASDT